MSHFGEIANVAQLAGLDAVRLIGMIAKAATTARMHKKNCRQFAQHLKLIGNLLESLKVSELRKYSETREPLEQLEDALRRSYILVNSCQDRSYLYLLAMGWNIVYQFRQAQIEIDRYLKIIPLITLVNNTRIRERLEMIERDQREYTMDDEDRRVQDVILRREHSQHDTIVLKKSLSCSYPNMPIKEAIQKESEKLQLELQHSQANLDVGQCEVIQHLLEVTHAVNSNSSPDKTSPVKESKVKHFYVDPSHDKSYSDRNYTKGSNKREASGRELPLSKASQEEWHSDLLGCCSESLLCVKTLFFPCGTFSRVASVATNKQISPGDACNDLMAYSLILSCCCYTCCIRRKLRTMLNIRGGAIDDFLSHLMCCCCALVQEWREIEIRQAEGSRTSPPTVQCIEY
ncbi:cell number regulator 13-like [Andrographis paniculata]|uniref:cell number regulator 13-like n=1 Tax=Andrographis paniculata TaxID=175694 RepID=UPI0021E85428|nr:cell number regulator 13-like [Andrographis paniculata]XP_051126893.1 cell number regulator 13-like [Andrographis paniculata]